MEILKGIAKIEKTYSETEEADEEIKETNIASDSKFFNCCLCMRHWCSTFAIIICFIVYSLFTLLKEEKLHNSFFISLCEMIRIGSGKNDSTIDVCDRDFI